MKDGYAWEEEEEEGLTDAGLALVTVLSLSRRRIARLYRSAEASFGGSAERDLYSFHEDEIPAASLLHPCKVTFLPRGVVLPSGVSSFVCWRVYDVMNECVWWLTDKDYIDVSGRSFPRSMNSPTTSQVKAGTDGAQNNNSSSSSHGKGRKRERADHSSESVKRERTSRIDDSGSGSLRTDSRTTCFDEWLQEIHKGKIGDASSPKDNDRSVDDFLLILLRALDKLPVNLNALQTCNIGKSVNHLRSHKNSEIGKKARSLVDTWKKRVEAEMDAKSGSNQGASWPGRSRQSEVFTATSVSHLHPSKPVSVKIPSDYSMKSATTSPSSTRSDPSPGTGVAAVNDGHKRSTSALHREVGLSRSSSSQRTATFEKVSPSTLTPERTLDVPVAEGCSNKLIVKLPKRGRSPAQCASGGSFEDHAAGNSRAPSPVPSENHDQFDRNVKEMNDAYRANFSSDTTTESSQNNDLKSHPDEVAGSPSVNAGDEHAKAVTESTKVAVKSISPALGDDVKTAKRHGGSHSSMNALIESCVREANACMAGADDVGMNLLATVAADEMSKSPVASPLVSRVSDPVVNDNSNSENHKTVIIKSSDGLQSGQVEAKDPTIVDNDQHVSSSGEELAAVKTVNDSKPGDIDENSDSEIEELQRLVDQCLESNENSDDVSPTAVPTSGIGENMSDDCDSGVVSDLKTEVISSTDQVAGTVKRIENSVLN
ncbi:hypothetical protein Bca52824_040001 [Brassica carinata]|uniref:TFIIS N-terminal domain-containing protein n=1 Tax=Brassica carinata TaxID=52824 RepID=A0A8X7RSP7_BRACI|nr:hypothetical protein Bca52824_040001 [Brassica carinata]